MSPFPDAFCIPYRVFLSHVAENTANGGQSRMVRNLKIHTKQFRRKLLWVALLCLGASLVFLYDRVVGGLV